MFLGELTEPITLRLAKGMAEVNLEVLKEHAADGSIKLGEIVNVNLTMKIADADGKETIRKTQIARECRVISNAAVGQGFGKPTIASLSA